MQTFPRFSTLALSLLTLAGPASAQLLGDTARLPAADTLPGGYAEGFFVLDNRLVGDTDAARLRVGQTSNLRGGGAEARVEVVPGVAFLTGEYRRTSFDRAVTENLNTGASSGVALDRDLTTIRGGAGVGGRLVGVPLYVRGEYSSLQLSGGNAGRFPRGRQNGFGVLAGVSGALNRYVGVTGEAGYQNNKDFGRGLEYRVGGWLNVLPNLALTLHYRRTRLDDANSGGFKRAYLETGGAGIRFQFGGYGLPLPGPGVAGP